MNYETVEAMLNLMIFAFLLMLTVVFVSGTCVIIVSTVRELNR